MAWPEEPHLKLPHWGQAQRCHRNVANAWQVVAALSAFGGCLWDTLDSNMGPILSAVWIPTQVQ